MSVPMATGINSDHSPLSRIGPNDKCHDDAVVGLDDRVSERHADVEMFGELEQRIVLIEEGQDEEGQSCRHPGS